ncbi:MULTISPECIES: thiaminase II [unclassified Pantoea]|uniref:thiaminase II n=1 Tax=unclassified Pantoea TaxID=2630326 RepID=UPI001231A4CA|nr:MULTISPECIES: thiaminase II [unclassified Pantoea]KAA5974421.1 thiaminase II [Pantoea sp. M_6]KAA5978317.1 thiaminase II [Pantoea sp. M_8]KAA5989928.1 thiaminase II [Pantoea sp. M_10]KAA6002844.1 thiaminase II [Pantoea sp. M_5]
MTHPLFETGFYGRLRQQAGPHWHAYVAHDFVQQLGQGTLPPAAFRHYLTQDYLFLLHFARAWGLLISKLSAPDALRSATASLNAIVSELPLHLDYCQQWGISEAAMASEPEAVETLNYTRYVLDVGHSGDALELLTALMPCVAGYAETGLTLLQDPATRFSDNPYAAWIENYGDESYLNGVRNALSLFETLAGERAAEQRFASLAQIFTTATRLESAFWQMGLNHAASRQVRP